MGQIMLTTCMMETGYFLFEAQTEDKESGDIGGDSWVRYDDEETKTFKLNVERQNGRAAMLGITGCLVHELLGGATVLKRGPPVQPACVARREPSARSPPCSRAALV